MAPVESDTAISDDIRGRMITALVSFFVMALLSLFIPYATIAVGILLALFGGLALLWERIFKMRRIWWFYIICGLLLAGYGIYLTAGYLQQLSLT